MRRPVMNSSTMAGSYWGFFSLLRGLNVKSTMLGLMALMIITSSIISTGIVAFLPSDTVSAASPKSQTGTCENNFQFTNNSSPFSATAGQCLGRDTVDGLSFYQFAIDLPGKIDGVKISGEDGSGKKIAFVKENDTQYVSTDGLQEGLGYQASGASAQCDEDFDSNKITITVSGGENNPNPVPLAFNLCDYWNVDFVVYPPVSGVKSDGAGGGTGVSTGTIIGNFCSIRNANNLLANQATGLLDKQGIKSITLIGDQKAYIGSTLQPVNVLRGDGPLDTGGGSIDDSWYTLTNGTLTIPNLKPDTYTLSITYDDVVVLMSQTNGAGDPNATTENLKFDIAGTAVFPGDPTYITNKDGTPQCYNNDGTIGDPERPSDIEKESSCVVEWIGWIVCGVMRGLALANDAMYGAVEGLLITTPLQANNPDTGKPSAQYVVWQAIRDISNVLLVVAFLIIIFSQATSIGISSYGIKKMLPRLIIAAIAINLSFFAMQLAVDLANLLGVGLNNFTNNIAEDAFGAAQISMEDTVGSFLTGSAAIVATAGIAALLSGFSASALAFLILPFLVGGVLAVFAAFITLFLRNALIIVLVMIAPLAFAAYLLPNTESLFTKWRKLLTSMLLLFPTAALLFAGAKVAGFTVTSLGGPINVFFGYVITVLPLFMLPWLAQQGGGVMKSISNQMQGLAGRAKKPLQDFVKPYVDRERDAYTSRAAGYFGRRRGFDEETGELLADQKTWRAEQKAIRKARKPTRDALGNRVPGVDDHGNPIPPDNRTLRQKIAQGRKDVEGDAANYKELVERQYAQRAVTDPHGKTGKIMAQKEDLHLLGEAQKEEMMNHQKERMNTEGTNANASANRIADAGVDKRKLENIQKSIQAKRVLNPTTRSTMQHGRNLAEVAKEAYTAEEVARDDELKVDHQNKRDNTVADKAIQSQKLTQEQIKGIETRQQKDYDKKKEVEGNPEYEAAKVQEFNTRESTSSNAVATALIDKAAESDATQILAADRKFESEQLSGIVEGDEKNRQEARLGPAGDLTELGDKKAAVDTESQVLKDEAGARLAAMKIADNKVKVAGEDPATRAQIQAIARRSAIAKSTQSKAGGAEILARAKEIDENPQGSLAVAMAATDDAFLPEGVESENIATGISGSTARVAGQASKDVLEDERGDVAVTLEDYGRAGVGNNNALAGLGKNRNGDDLPADEIFVAGTDGTRIREVGSVDFIDRVALIEHIANGGDYGANLVSFQYVIEQSQLADLARKAAATAKARLESMSETDPGYADAKTDFDTKQEYAKKQTHEALTYSKAIAQSKALPPYLGAEDIDALKAGRLIKPIDQLELESAVKGKYTIPKLQSFDKDHYVELAKTITKTFKGKSEADIRDMDYGDTEITHLQRLVQTLDQFQDDPKFKGVHKPETLDALDDMREVLVASVGPGKTEEGEDYYRPDYVSEGEVKKGDDGKPVPKIVPPRTSRRS